MATVVDTKVVTAENTKRQTGAKKEPHPKGVRFFHFKLVVNK